MRRIIQEVETDEGIFIEGKVSFGGAIILSWCVKVEPWEGESFADAKARAIKAAEVVPTIEEIEEAEAEEGQYGPN